MITVNHYSDSNQWLINWWDSSIQVVITYVLEHINMALLAMEGNMKANLLYDGKLESDHKRCKLQWDKELYSLIVKMHVPYLSRNVYLREIKLPSSTYNKLQIFVGWNSKLWKYFVTNHRSDLISVGSRISPRWECQLPGGANIRFCQISPKTAWNWKNLDSRGRPSRPLRSTTVNAVSTKH